MRCIIFVSMWLLASCIRVVKRDEVEVDACTGSLTRRVNCTLSDLKGAHPNALSNLLGGIASLNFSRDLGPQLRDLAVSTAVGFGQAIASSIHPVLGIIFSIFSALFGFGGNDQADFVKSILDQVEDMITEKVDIFAQTLVREQVSGALSTISNAAQYDDVARWNNAIDGKLIGTFASVFKSCWDSPDSAECRRWRTAGASGQALLLEVQYSELMVATVLKYAEYGKNSYFAMYVNRAAVRSRGHFETFNAYRRNWSSTESGVTGGSASCAGRTPAFCWHSPARDHLTGKDVCEISRVDTPRSLHTAKRAELSATFTKCLNKYKGDIARNLDKLGRETAALKDAAQRIYNIMK